MSINNRVECAALGFLRSATGQGAASGSAAAPSAEPVVPGASSRRVVISNKHGVVVALLPGAGGKPEVAVWSSADIQRSVTALQSSGGGQGVDVGLPPSKTIGGAAVVLAIGGEGGAASLCLSSDETRVCVYGLGGVRGTFLCSLKEDLGATAIALCQVTKSLTVTPSYRHYSLLDQAATFSLASGTKLWHDSQCAVVDACWSAFGLILLLAGGEIKAVDGGPAGTVLGSRALGEEERQRQSVPTSLAAPPTVSLSLSLSLSPSPFSHLSLSLLYHISVP